MSFFAIAKRPTPLLNTPDFKGIFGEKTRCHLPLDSQGLLRQIETIALPSTKFQVLEEFSHHICLIKTQDYAAEQLYTDKRFLEPVSADFPERTKTLPSIEVILERMKALVGLPYVWGGNWSAGIPEMLKYYPPSSSLDELTHTTWTLRGVDCSGLLYETTEGFTPRNTAELIHYGNSLPIFGLKPKQIATKLQKLDALVWRGHVVFVLNSHQTIESRGGHGVIISSLEQRLEEIMETLTPVDDWDSTSLIQSRFVIKRWYEQNAQRPKESFFHSK